MPERTTWILVCDASRARIFTEEAPGRPFSLLASFEHPESRERVRDLVADANGRKPVGGPRAVTGPRLGGGFHGRPGAEPDTDPKEVEAEKFARALAAELAQGADAHAFESVVVAAPPHFLGLLRDNLPEKVRRRVALTLDKDLTLVAAREVERRVRADRAA